MSFWSPAARGPEELPGYRLVFAEDFDGPALDDSRWVATYLAHWSSRERSAPGYRLADGALTLYVAEGQLPWCPEFDGDVRVSALQTGQFSGPLGSAIGQHRFNDRVRVRELQPMQRLYAPTCGRIEMRARAWLDRHALASLYLIGFEEDPENSGEITVMEVFGHNVFDDGVVLGRGVKQINDPRLATDFVEDKLPFRLDDWHIYSIDWTGQDITFGIDGRGIGRTTNVPHYAMQLMLTFYQLPGEPGHGHDPESRFEIDYVRGYEAIGPR